MPNKYNIPDSYIANPKGLGLGELQFSPKWRGNGGTPPMGIGIEQNMWPRPNIDPATNERLIQKLMRAKELGLNTNLLYTTGTDVTKLEPFLDQFILQGSGNFR